MLPMKVVIIGGVAGGAGAAARLRRLDETAEILLLERGPYISYANCGLPYYIGGEIQQKSALTVQTPEGMSRRFGIDVRVNHEAVAIDTAKKTVTIQGPDGTVEESYDKLLLSPGAEPLRPPIPGLDDPRVFTLRTVPDTLKIKEYLDTHHPNTAAIVGGGYIGVEMAENLTRAGVKVTVIQLTDHVIAPLDYDMACDVHHYLEQQGVELLLNNGVKGISPSEDGLHLELEKGNLSADMVLLSVGVRPDTALAKAAGLALNDRGAILVDEHMRTSAPDVYAVGDAVEIQNFVTKQPGYIPLAGPAAKQARVAADHMCGLPSAYKGTQGSAVLKIFDMTVATTGLNESDAQKAGLAYEKIYAFGPSHAAYYPGATNQCVKVLFAPDTGRLLGAQIVGFQGVDKRCDVLATAIRAGLTAADLTELELCYAPPFSSSKDPVNIAGFMIENILTGKVKQYHWHDVASLPRDGSVTLLDVRTPAEYEKGAIDGTVNIPLDSLRQRLSELDVQKPVYVNCQSGLRSYLACRILMQHGFTCYNLAGGWRLYHSVTSDGAFDASPRHACGVKIQ